MYAGCIFLPCNVPFPRASQSPRCYLELDPGNLRNPHDVWSDKTRTSGIRHSLAIGVDYSILTHGAVTVRSTNTLKEVSVQKARLHLLPWLSLCISS